MLVFSAALLCSSSVGPDANAELKQQLLRLKTSQLKNLLAARGIDCLGCVEKAHLVDRVRETLGLPLLNVNESRSADLIMETGQQLLFAASPGGTTNSSSFFQGNFLILRAAHLGSPKAQLLGSLLLSSGLIVSNCSAGPSDSACKDREGAYVRQLMEAASQRLSAASLLIGYWHQHGLHGYNRSCIKAAEAYQICARRTVASIWGKSSMSRKAVVRDRIHMQTAYMRALHSQ
jgi:hypothetical protein